MSELFRRIDSIPDATGDRVGVGVYDDKVTLQIEGGCVWLDAAQREQFQRAFMEAERQAEAQAPAMCATPDDCVNGPDVHAFVPDSDRTLPCCRQPWEEDEGSSRTFPIYARFAYPDHGYKGDRELCAGYLTPGDTYLIDYMDVGRSHTTIYLHDFRGTGFNSTMFAAGTEAGWAATQEREEAREYRRPCCDHCNNLAGDPDGHDYGDEAAHDGPCGQCADEQAREEAIRDAG